MSLSRKSSVRRMAGVLVAVAGAAVAAQSALAGTWTKIVNNPPGAVGLMLLLPDGTVMCSNQNGSTIGQAWYKLTPNASGSYVNGTWSTLASMPNTRLYFQSQVLRDNRVFVSGGEYGTGGPLAAMYNIATNSWTNVTPTNGTSFWNTASENFYDGSLEILPDHTLLLCPVIQTSAHSSPTARTMKYNPATNVWSNTAGRLVRGGGGMNEATWAKLPDNTILTLDAYGANSFGNAPSSRFNPPTDTWINDSVSPVNLYDAFGFETGGAAMLPNGKCLFIGGNGNNALYTPTGTTSPGTWVAAPTVANRGAPDAPLAPMVDGNVLVMFSTPPTSANHFPSPSYFYEYQWATNTFSAQLSAPGGGTSLAVSTYLGNMLCLPNGQIMFSYMNSNVYVYTPSGAPLASSKPTIQSITKNLDGTFHMTGTLINGITEGASYGDDWQQFTNYPIVRINHSNGNVYYARTFNWSSTSLATGATPLTTEYALPAGMPVGDYSLVVTPNGVASDSVTKPAITDQPDPQAVRADYESASFTVAASGIGPISYQWRRNGVNLTNGGSISGATGPTLSFSPASIGDNGVTIDCVVSNAIGSVTSTGVAYTVYCPSDFNLDGFVTGDDFDGFMDAFTLGDPAADFNEDTFVTGDDFDAFTLSFEAGC